MKETNKISGKKSWCRLHKTHLPLDNSECRIQQQQLKGNNRNNRNGQRNGQHQYQADNNRAIPAPARVNTATTPGSTTAVWWKLQQYDSSIIRNYQIDDTDSLSKTPPRGMGYSFVAAASTATNVNFTMTADSDEPSHSIDNRLLPGIEKRMLSNVHLEPPAIINAAGCHRLSGVGKGILMVQVEDQQGVKRHV